VCDLSAIRDAYLSAPEEAVFLERARVLDEATRKYAAISPGLRQAKILRDLCEQVSVVVNPQDVLLGRVREEVPTGQQEAFVRERPELFVQPGLPGWLDSGNIYIPDWAHLVRSGIGGLIQEVEQAERRADSSPDGAKPGRDVLEGIRLSLLAVSDLIRRYAAEARRVAAVQKAAAASARLLRAARCCDAVASDPPTSLREALQLLVLFHMVLSCLVGGRNVTPGRMDQYLLEFYERDLASGALTRREAVELLAVAMLMFSQLSGAVATDFQSRKRTPNRFSHYYITIGGQRPDGESGVNDLSWALLEARRLVEFRDPSLCVRYFQGIDREFWREAVRFMRDGMAGFTCSDRTIVGALTALGVPECAARDYAYCGCMVCFLPGRDLPPLRANHNGPLSVLLAMNGGRDPMSGQTSGEPTPPPEELDDFEAFFAAFRAQLRHSLARSCRHYAGGGADRFGAYPLVARCLLRGYLAGEPAVRWADQHLVGVATTIDSLLSVREVVYRRRTLTLAELAQVLREDFADCEDLRACLMNRMPCYGSDDPDVAEMVRRVGEAWVEEVGRAGAQLDSVRLRPAFYSWLFNIELGERTGATPDGRAQGAPLSSDQTPTRGKSRVPTEVLRSMAELPHRRTCSGGTTFRLSPSHFRGEAGVDRLAALIEGYFAEGGLQLQFIFADSAVLRDAVLHPDRHRDLLVRVAGFTERFVRLLPQVQQDIIRRAEYAEGS